jgi:hypothetical protein
MLNVYKKIECFLWGKKGERPCEMEIGGRGRGKRNPRDEGDRGGG